MHAVCSPVPHRKHIGMETKKNIKLPVRPDYLPFGKPNFSGAEIEAVTRVVSSGWIGMGGETAAFEEELAAYTGAPHVVTVNSCTSALFLSLIAAGVGPGDEVICPSLTWCATANVALQLGAQVVFCDVDCETLSVTPEAVAEQVTDKTKAVIAVHFGGLAIDIKALQAALPDRVIIIEDAAHAIGARFADGSTVGSSGNLTCFSFYANKNLSTGDGGAIALYDEENANRLRSLRQNGMSLNAWKRFTHPQNLLADQLEVLGYKMNFNDLQACIARVQLKRQEEFHAWRLAIANQYRDGLPNLAFQTGSFNDDHARHLLVTLLPVERMTLSRNELVLKLREANIGASIHYAPLHKMPLYLDGGSPTKLPNTDWICERNMTLPISASMTDEDARYVIRILSDLLGA